VLGGKRLPKGHDYCEEETGYKYLRVTDIQKDNLRRLDLKNLKTESFKAISRYVVDEGNVVITIAGTIGATRYIDFELAGVNLTENAAKIVLRDPERVDPIYLTHALQSEEVQKQIRASTGQVIGKLALFRIEALEVPLPSINEQRRFSRYVTESRQVRGALAKNVNTTDSLFSSLQHRAFSGQL
jgi:type I restriction enzyme S subunit